jgi:hypothetical protein
LRRHGCEPFDLLRRAAKTGALEQMCRAIVIPLGGGDGCEIFDPKLIRRRERKHAREGGGKDGQRHGRSYCRLVYRRCQRQVEMWVHGGILI